MILSSQDEWDYDDSNQTDYPILTASFVNSQQPYTLPSGTLQIKRLEVSYDSSKWYKADPFDIGERDTLASDVNSLGDFTIVNPKYDVEAGSLFIYPIPTADVTIGLKIWIARGPKEFTLSDLTTGTLTPGFASLFHVMLAFGAATDYCMKSDLKRGEVFAQQYAVLAEKMKDFYSETVPDRILTLGFKNTNYK